MNKKKIDFSSIEWDSSNPEIKTKIFQQDENQIRILEISKELYHPDWCKTGHIGFVMEGELEIEFDDETINYKKRRCTFYKSRRSRKAYSKTNYRKSNSFF